MVECTPEKQARTGSVRIFLLLNRLIRFRHPAALLALLAAAGLIYSLAALWFAPAPGIDVTEANTRIVFRAAQSIVVGRCGEVSWQVGENLGVWVSGQGVAPEGTMRTCIDQYFTRPQINVALPDGTWRLYELPMTSLVYSGETALTFTLRIIGAAVLVSAAVLLWGWRLPFTLLKFDKLISIRFHKGLARQTPTSRFSVLMWLCIALWLAYLTANLFLRLNTPITSAPAEAYITPTTIQQAWESAERPITIPLIYKLLNNDFEAIAWLQWGLAVLCWSALAGVTLLHIRSNILRVLAGALILSLSLARDVYFWNSVLISESISQSLFILLVAIGMFALWCYQRSDLSLVTQVTAALGVFIVTVIWSFTRDANSYVALAAALLLIASLTLFLSTQYSVLSTPRLPLWRKFAFPLMLAVLFIGLFVFQNRDADRGLRWRYPLMNVIARRVLPFPDEVAFFAARGMPTTPDVMRFAGQFAWAYDLSPIEPWLTQESRRVYLQYLLAAPLETFLTPLNEWEMLLLFDYRVIQEHRRDIVLPVWIDWLTGFAYPEHLGLVVVSTLGWLLLGLWAWRAADRRLVIVGTLILLWYPLAFIAWFGDGFAVERHAVPDAIQWRLAMWLAILFACDALLYRRFPTQRTLITMAR